MDASLQKWSQGFMTSLKKCRKDRNLQQALQLHDDYISKHGSEHFSSIGNQLVSLLVDVGSMCCAQKVFDRLSLPDESSWNSLIVGYAKLKDSKSALSLYQKMSELDESLHLSVPAFMALLKACTLLKDVKIGEILHAKINERGLLDFDVFIGCSLVDMYAKCGFIMKAQEVFDRLPVRDVVSWTSMISVYARHDESAQALSLYEQMLSLGIRPNKVTFSSILTICANLEYLVEGTQTHAYLIECGFELDVIVKNALISMYAKCGAIENAQAVFDEMKVRDVVSWTAMIVAYAQNRQGEDALRMFRGMLQSDVMPNVVTFINILSACTSITSLLGGMYIHVFIIECGLDSQHAIVNALLSLYGICGCLDDANNIFWRTHPDVSNWTTMIAMFAQHGYSSQAFCLFDHMQEKMVELNKITLITILNACTNHAFLLKGQEIHVCIINVGYDLDVELGNALLNMYSKCGSLESAEKTFYRMVSQDVVSWTSMIVAYVGYKLCDNAFEVFQSMIEQSVNPDSITFISILSACTHPLSLQLGQNIHAKIVERGLQYDVVLGNSLLTMYGKCGSLINAQMVFESMHEKNTISWNALISFHINSSNIGTAFKLFQQMVLSSVKLDKVSFLNILSICIGEDLIDQGRLIHMAVAENGFEKDMEVMNALIMMYGKCGNVIDAKGVFDKFQHHNVVTWTSMIAAYAQSGNSQEVVNLFYKMLSSAVKPDKFTLSLVIASCSTSDMLQDGENIHASMVQNNIESDIILDNALINMYGKCGNLVNAQKVFEEILERD